MLAGGQREGRGRSCRSRMTNRRGGGSTSRLGRLPVLPALHFLLLPSSLWAVLATVSWTTTPLDTDSDTSPRARSERSANSWLGHWRHAVGVKGASPSLKRTQQPAGLEPQEEDSPRPSTGLGALVTRP